jgi:hypothetical protein
MSRPNRLVSLALIAAPWILHAQTSPDVKMILDRLDRLEQENRELANEVHALRAELAASRPAPAEAPESPSETPASLPEQVAIDTQRIDEQAQTKVEASQHFPIRLTGMALFNAFMDSRQSGGTEYPVVATNPGPGEAGATLRQTILGLEFTGPMTIGGGKVSGSVYMDFFSSLPSTTTQVLRLRTGSIQIDWKTRSVMVGVEKPIFNPREPSSLAQVGVSPLTGAGNLWLWIPQARFEQDFRFDSADGLRARFGVVETQQGNSYISNNPLVSVEAARPALEGRFEFYHNFDDERRFEFASGFHSGVTHAMGASIPSNLYSFDWFLNPWRRLEFTGAFFSGQNVASLGAGTRQGILINGLSVAPIHAVGGWGQFTIRAASRLDIHLFAGQQDYRDSDLLAGDVGKNLLYGANFFYHLAPNVIIGPETTQLRTVYLGQRMRINNHYDLALAYLF